jgi:serine/threonine protein phosphatase PrpC
MYSLFVFSFFCSPAIMLRFVSSTLAGNVKNEDRSFSAIVPIRGNEKVQIFSVLDGHGGPECAEYAEQNLPKNGWLV